MQGYGTHMLGAENASGDPNGIVTGPNCGALS